MKAIILSLKAKINFGYKKIQNELMITTGVKDIIMEITQGKGKITINTFKRVKAGLKIANSASN